MTRLAALALLSLAACAPGAGNYRVGDLQGEEFLRVRSGPGLGYEVLTGLTEGSMVRRGACEQVGGTSWCRVAANGTLGYVAGAYLDPV